MRTRADNISRAATTLRRVLRLSAFSVAYSAIVAPGLAADPAKVTYEDDVLPIFRNNCLKCHNPDKLKGDLDLTSFSSAIKGGGSGTTLNAGDPEGSQLFKSITHADEPTMPPNAKLADKDIAVIRKWIEGGLLQGANSRAIAANKPAVDLALKSVSIGKPDGPPPMPGNLPLDPVVRAARGSALSALATSPWAPVAALAGPRQIVLYNTSDLEFIGVLPFPDGFPCDVKFSRNGKLLLASGGRGGQSGLVVVWDIATGERVITVGDQFDSVLAADLSADQQRVALGGPDRVLKVYTTKDGALQHRIKKHTEWVTAVEFSPDGKYLASGDRNGGLALWEAETGHELFNLVGHKAGITAITWRSDSEMFGSASEDGTIKLWKASDGSALRSITAHAGGALSARFTHDGRIVSCGRDNKVQLWDTTGKNIRTLPFNGDLPNRVAFTDDGKRVIGSDWKGTVLVWDAATAKVVGELDATPPPLSDRVEQGAQRIAALEAELKKAVAAQTAAETEAQAARAKLDDAKKALANARSALTNHGGAVIKASEQLATDPENAAAKQQLADARQLVDSFPAKIAALQKQINSETQKAALAGKKVDEAKSVVDAARGKVAAAKASLTRWQAALQNAATRPASGKVSLR
jgi:hypothetical protein